MVKIQNPDEFNSIKKSDFGYMIEVKKDSHTIHKTKCKSLDVNNFIDSTDAKSTTTFHWFSTIALVEKSFPDTVPCSQCNPN